MQTCWTHNLQKMLAPCNLNRSVGDVLNYILYSKLSSQTAATAAFMEGETCSKSAKLRKKGCEAY